LGVRLWMPYAALPLGFTMFLLRLIADLVAVLLKIVPPFGLDDN
jgi:TRAP-type C4-dicarboxylate transport system permease small subunit